MSDKSLIEWTDATWNPIRGCSRVSEGCTGCYAEGIAARFSGPGQPYEGLARMQAGKPRWTGEVRFIDNALDAPLRWKRPRKIFVNSMSDLFHEKVPDEWIDRIFAVMALSPQHTFQILTKRPERMQEYMTTPDRKRTMAETVMELSNSLARKAGTHEARIKLDHFTACFRGSGAFPNVWLGISVEDQATADERIPLLLQTPAAIRFVSCEPALGPVDFTRLPNKVGLIDALRGHHDRLMGQHNAALQWDEGVYTTHGNALHWIIMGGESGPKARPMHPDWARSVRDQCQAAGVPFFFKQWGEWLPGEANHGQFDHRPMHAYRRVDNHTYDWPPGEHHRENFGCHPDRFSGDWTTMRIGKKRAGRLLDGVEHNGFPAISEARAAA